MNIVLLGFMGTGKTAVGKMVARKLKIQYVDIDDAIEKETKMTVSHIFAEFGEEYFRGLEKKMVLKISRQDKQVISAGGGVVLNPENIENLNSNGFLICLDANADVIYQRTRRFAHRPLIKTADPKKSIGELLKKREKNYARIKNHIDTSDLTKEEVAEQIIASFKENNVKWKEKKYLL